MGITSATRPPGPCKKQFRHNRQFNYTAFILKIVKACHCKLMVEHVKRASRSYSRGYSIFTVSICREDGPALACRCREAMKLSWLDRVDQVPK